MFFKEYSMSKFGIRFVDSRSRSSKGFFVHVRNGDIIENTHSEPGDIVIAGCFASSLIIFKYGEILKVFDESIWLEEISKEKFLFKINNNKLAEEVFSKIKKNISCYKDMLKDYKIESLKIDKIENQKAFLHVEKLKNKICYEHLRAWNPYYHYNLEKDTVWYKGGRDYLELSLGMILAWEESNTICYCMVESVDLDKGFVNFSYINEEFLQRLYKKEDIVLKLNKILCS